MRGRRGSGIDRLFDGGRRRERRAWAVAAVFVAALGAINWGLVGVAGIDLVGTMLGAGTRASRLVYMGLGIAGLATLLVLPRLTRR